MRSWLFNRLFEWLGWGPLTDEQHEKHNAYIDMIGGEQA